MASARHRDAGTAAASQDIIDLSLDGPGSGPRRACQQPLAQPNHQLGCHPDQQPEIGRSLWGELNAAETGPPGADIRPPQWRRRRPPAYLQDMSAPPVAAEQASRPGADSLTDLDDGWSYLHDVRSKNSRFSDSPAPAQRPRQQASHASQRRSAQPPTSSAMADAVPVSPPRRQRTADDQPAFERRFGSPRARKLLQDALVARRLQQEEETAAAQAAHAAQCQAEEDAALQRRMDELAAMEAAQDWAEADAADFAPPGAFAHQSAMRSAAGRWRTGGGGGSDAGSRGRARMGASGRRRDFGDSSLADAMLGMLSQTGSWGGMHFGRDPDARLPGQFAGGHPLFGRTGSSMDHVSSALGAMRAAMAGMATGSRLPPAMLFSDRDFDENDYEALLALDEGVENRKGASQAAIDAIPTLVLPASGCVQEEEPRCPICLADYESGATLRRLQCGHKFHRTCLDSWLKQKATCPICQSTGC